MNILVISSYYHPAHVYGGPVSALCNLNRALALSGHGVTTYTTDANGTGDLAVLRGKPVIVDGLQVLYFSRWWFGQAKKPFNLFFSPEMGNQLRRLQPGNFDLILNHAGWSDPGRMAALTARRTGIPFIYYTYGCFEPWAFNYKYWKKRMYLSLIERKILQEAAGIVVSNDAEIEQLRQININKPTNKIPCESIIEPCNTLGLPSQERIIELYPLLGGRPFLLFLSRLHPKKGLDLLIPAFQKLAREFPDWLLVLAGPDEGGYRTQVERMVQDLGLEDRVLFTGWVTGEAKSALLAHADLFVLPSYSEGFPVVVAEALSYGRPMVITTTCYVPEVEEEGAGLVVPPKMEALTLALREMLGDAGLRQKCAHQALELARQHFTWKSVADKSLAFFHEVM